MFVTKKLFAFGLMIVMSNLAFADKYLAPIISIPKLTKPPVIDGKISKDEWKNATVIDGFEVMDLKYAPKEKTRAWIGYDDKNLYIAARCFMQKGIEPKSDIGKHDGPVYTDDCIEIFIDPNHSGQDYHFAGNSLGTKFDELNMKSDWDANWQYKAHRTKFGWECEISIPFSSFGISKAPENQAWGFLLGRTVQRPRQQFSQWAGNVANAWWHNPKMFGTIIFNDYGATFVIDKLKARGRAIEFRAKLIGAKNKSEKVTVNITLNKRTNPKQAVKQAVVMIFESKKARQIWQFQKELTLKPKQTFYLPTPKLPEKAGKYLLIIDVRDSRGKPLLIQNIPIDVILHIIKTNIRRIPSAGVAEIEINVGDIPNSLRVKTVKCKLIDKKKKTIWKHQSPVDKKFKAHFKFISYGKITPGNYSLEISACDSS